MTMGELLTDEIWGREVLLPAALPPGDGAISAGQCCVTRAILEP